MIAWTSLPVGSLTSRFFVSYSSTRTAMARAVATRLREAGQEVWRDRETMQPGDAWREEVSRGIRWTEEMVVLLCPAAAESVEVRNEITMALEQRKRVTVFATFDPRAHALYALVAHLNLEIVPPFPEAGDGYRTAMAAKQIAQKILKPHAAPHPLSQRDFERVYSRILLPPMGRQGLTSDLARRYASYEAGAGPEMAAMLRTNFALLHLGLGESDQAETLLQDAARGSASPVPDYFLAMALTGGKSPRHVDPSRIERAAACAETAYRRAPTPLVALQMALIYWDAGIKRGAGLSRLAAEALEALPGIAPERLEIPRFLDLSGIRRAVSAPLPAERIVTALEALSKD